MPFEQQISTHALREEGDGKPLLHDCIPDLISTHALLEEGDMAITQCNSWTTQYFYPRPPRGGRRLFSGKIPISRNFYPRPPRGGRRFRLRYLVGPKSHFYPRPPRGGRRILYQEGVQHKVFLPTPSARRATENGHGL